MSKNLSPDDLFTWFNEISIIAQLSGNLFERALPGDLTTSQFSVLNWFVRVDSEATPARLATAFQVTRGAMTNTLKKLEAKGFIEIRPNEDSGRSKLVTMTPAGRKMRDEAIQSAAPLLATFAENVDPAVIAAQLPQIREIRTFLDEFRFRDER